jgi:tetratricopeptide (TPR) repeat protein
MATMGQTNRAIDDFSKAIARNPNYSDAFHNRGLVRQRTGDKVGALADFDQAITLAPYFVGAYFSRGTFYYANGEYDLALEDYTAAIERSTDQPLYREHYSRRIHSKSLAARGVLFRKRGFLNKAIADYQASIDVDPEFADPYMGLANMLALQGKFSEAIKLNTKAIKLSTDDSIPFINRGLAFLKLEKYQKAIEDFTTVILLDRKSVEAAYKYRALAHGKLGKYDLYRRDRKKFEELEAARKAERNKI